MFQKRNQKFIHHFTFYHQIPLFEATHRKFIKHKKKMSEEEFDPIVFDNGASTIKTGYGGYEAPLYVFKSVVGYKKPHLDNSKNSNDFFVGDDISSQIGIQLLHHPIERGIITNWDDNEKIWHYSFYNKIKTDPSKHPILVTEPLQNPKECREKTIQIMFETFNVPSFYFGNQGYLSICSNGYTTGVVLDIGDSITQIVPIYQSHVLPNTYKINFGGRDLNECLFKLLTERKQIINPSTGIDIIQDIKEKLCYVALDYNSEIHNNKELNKAYKLQNGSNITLNNEIFTIPELLFNPSLDGLLNGMNCSIEYGIHKLVFDSIMKSDEKLRNYLFSFIFLSGGSSMFEGLENRLQKEISSLAPSSMTTKVIASPDRNYAVWIGGSIISTIETFPKISISKDEYWETGPSIVHSKC